MKTRLLLMLLLVSSFTYSQTFPTNDLIAWYDFANGSLLVDGANGQNFTKTGTASTEVNDRFGNSPTSAIDLGGDYLTRPDMVISGSNALSFAVSYSFWIKSSTNSPDAKTIFDDSTRDTAIGFDSNDVGYFIYYRNGKIILSSRYYQAMGTNTPTAQGYSHENPQVISDGNWHHIVVLFNPTFVSGIQRLNSKIYIDGVANSKSFNNGGSTFTTSPNTTGNVTVANSRTNHLALAYQYTDVLDDILIYNRALTPAEVTSIATDNSFCFTPSSSILSASAITDATATIDITNNANTFDIAYHKTTEPFSSATIISGITSGTATSQANLTGLDVSTDYLVYVREQCTITTDWSSYISFQTTRPIGRLYVNKNATGANNGLSWADAFTDLQDALTEAVATEEIWIAQGTYTPHASDRTVYYVIDKADLNIYGGFAGTETLITERVLGANETILSGDLQDNDVNNPDYILNYSNTTRNGDNSYRVINILNTGNNLLLDGLTISDAHNNINASAVGGAIITAGDVKYLTLKNCTIKDNVSRNTNAGLYMNFDLQLPSRTGGLVVENCKFINNMSRAGTAIFTPLSDNSTINISVANTLFDGNLAGNLNTTSALGLAGSSSWFRVTNNGSNITLNLTNNTYVNNIDTGTGSSLNNFSRATVAISESSGVSSTLNATVNNCIFWGNITTGGGNARAITDLFENPVTSLVVNNSLDSFNFSDSSVSSTTATITGDPLFTNTASGDYTLTATSPAIDTGNNAYVVGTEDLNGNSRIFNTTVDMGVYEYTSTLSTDSFELSENEIKLYPNPTTTVLNIKMKSNLKRATIYSVLGAKVLETTSKNITTSNLKSGLYLIKIQDENGSITTKRFIKK